MCLATLSTKKSRFVSEDVGDGAPFEYQNMEGVNTAVPGIGGVTSSGSSADSSSKMLGAVLTSLVALYVGMNRFNMTFYLVEQSSGGSGASKPIACCGILVVLAMRKVWNDRVGSMVENCSQNVDKVMMKVSSNKTLTRIKSSSMRLLDLATGRHEGSDGGGSTVENRRTPKLSIHAAPFVATEMIAELSLNDIKDLFRYVLEMNQNNFDRHGFFSEIHNWYCREVIHVMDRAVQSSRGETSIRTQSVTATPTTTINERPIGCIADGTILDVGDIDALYFVAVVCIFAEWRTLRLVPPVGYHRYSIGMGLAKRDLIQNAQKIECAVHQYIYEREKEQASCSCSSDEKATNPHQIPPISPSIRQLIKWEINRHVHLHLPKLREKSCASGFVWIYRQVQYQNNIFQNILHIPDKYPTSKAAVAAAYRSTYDDYHGFFIKNIFLSSFEAAPSHDEILQHMNPHTIPYIDISPTPQIVKLKSPLGSVTTMTHHRNPWEHVANHFVREWMKLERFMNQCHGQQNERNDDRNGLVVPPKDCSTLDLTNYTAENYEFTRAGDDKIQNTGADRAVSDIRAFCATFQPILCQLESLINHLNINDPSKC